MKREEKGRGGNWEVQMKEGRWKDAEKRETSHPIHRWKSRPACINQSVSELVSWFVSYLVSQSINQLVSQSNSKSVRQWKA